MTALQILLLNLLYDLLCLVLPWDQVDESICAKPLEWSGKTLGRFMQMCIRDRLPVEYPARHGENRIEQGTVHIAFH